MAAAPCGSCSGCRAGADGCRLRQWVQVVLRPMTCCQKRRCRRGCQRVPTALACCGNAFGCSAERFLQRVPSGCPRVATAPVVLRPMTCAKTQVPTRVPAGADLAGVLPKRFRLQRRAVLAGRVPKCRRASQRVQGWSERGTEGERDRRQAWQKRVQARKEGREVRRGGRGSSRQRNCKSLMMMTAQEGHRHVLSKNQVFYFPVLVS